MLRHYLKLFLHNFVRYRLYSALNVLGLGISLAVALIIGLFVYHQLSYEQNFEHADRIYNIGQMSSINRFGSPEASAPLVAKRFSSVFSSIEEITSASFSQQVMFGVEGVESDGTIENSIVYADERFFHLFNVDWLYGDPGKAITEPDSVVLTSSLARKYFGTEEQAYGNTLIYEKERLLKVTGVISDLPDSTYIRFRAVLPINLFYENYDNPGNLANSWDARVFRTYARFDRAVSGEALLQEMQPSIDKILGDRADQMTFRFRSITDLAWERNSGRIKLFGAIGLSILLIAVINFVNLATARASIRTIEVGVKRSLGAGRRQLVRQFLGESIALVCLAMIVALAIGELLLQVASNLLGVDLSYSVFFQPAGLVVLLLSTLGVGVLAGLYPAFYLSALKPAQGLKEQGLTGKGSYYFRNVLVVLQFSTSIVLLIATFVFLEQIRFTDKVDRGFAHENIVVVPFPLDDNLDVEAIYPILQDSLSAHSGIVDINLSQFSPLLEGIIVMPVRQEGSLDTPQFSLLSGRPDFLQFYGIELLTGDYFPSNVIINDQEDGSFLNISDRIILNEAALRWLGWSLDDAVGRTLYLGQDDDMMVSVIGVVRDVVVNPENEAEPYIYGVSDELFNNRSIAARMNIRLRQNETDAAMEHIRQVWSDYFPNALMQPTFLTERLEGQTRNQENQLKIFTYASIFAILVACFGLFGLATYNAERRTKEIGVRKVMGGSVWNIVLLLTNDFSKLVLLSNLIAWPVAYFIMNRWLENFAYRIDLSPLIFIGSGLIALCIAWVTVGGTAAKAASRKPVLALRYE